MSNKTLAVSCLSTVKDKYEFEEQPPLEVKGKGKGKMKMFFIK